MEGSGGKKQAVGNQRVYVGVPFCIITSSVLYRGEGLYGQDHSNYSILPADYRA